LAEAVCSGLSFDSKCISVLWTVFRDEQESAEGMEMITNQPVTLPLVSLVKFRKFGCPPHGRSPTLPHRVRMGFTTLHHLTS
jgi:hypothetical protein